jgi:anaerobic selenocysteine-containing dehydrogenase
MERSHLRVHSTCPHDCPSTCALEIEKLDARTIGRVYGAQNPYTAGVVCAKVARYAERIHHPDRLSQPLRRINPKSELVGKFEPVSWDDALDIVADRFQRLIVEYGAESIWPYHYAGTMGLVQRDGLERLRHCLGTSRQHSTFCTTLADAGWIAGVGAKRGSDSRLIAQSELVVVWGGNPVNTQVNLMHHISLARKSGARLVVVDPYLTATAEKADMHLMLKPGTDGALACAVMHVILRDGLEDSDYLDTRTDFDAAVRQHLSSCNPQWAADITGLTVTEIEAFAALYASTKKSFIRTGYGFSRSRNGSVNMHAVTCLPALTGAWRVRGGGALYSNAHLYPVDKTLIEGTDVLQPEIRVFDQSRIGDVLTGNPQDLQDGPPVKALFVQNTNPAVVAPESAKVQRGLMRDDLFVCVHEQFLTDTAQLADLVLPATMFAEHDDLYVAGGHTHIQMTKAIIEPFAQSRSNHDVLCALATRLGLQHPGFELTAWELCDETLKRSGLPDASTLLEKKWHDCLVSFEEGNFHNGFATDDGRFHFKPDWRSLGPRHQQMPALPTHWDVVDSSNEAYPLRLVAAPARQFLNTTFTETVTSVKKEKRPTLLMHPMDMQSQSLDDGQRVQIRSKCGAITAHARGFSGLQCGTVVMESIWPNSAFEGRLGVNTLISAEPGYPNGGAVFHDTAVAVSAAAADLV